MAVVEEAVEHGASATDRIKERFLKLPEILVALRRQALMNER